MLRCSDVHGAEGRTFAVESAFQSGAPRSLIGQPDESSPRRVPPHRRHDRDQEHCDEENVPPIEGMARMAAHRRRSVSRLCSAGELLVRVCRHGGRSLVIRRAVEGPCAEPESLRMLYAASLKLGIPRIGDGAYGSRATVAAASKWASALWRLTPVLT